jgi:hypothetical protein
MPRFFRVDAVYHELSTRTYLYVECPSFRVPIDIWDNRQ